LTNSIFFRENTTFEAFGLQHLFAIVFFIFVGFLFISWAKKLSAKKQIKVGNIFGASLSITIIIWTFLKIYERGNFDITQDLPFHLCNFIALFLPVFSFIRKKIYYEILLFWILAGTTQAILTPELKTGFPNYQFLKYWYVHASLIIFIFYATFIYKIQPTLKSVFYSFFALQGYFILVLFVNKLTGANYFYLNRKPIEASMLDYLGDWPYYILMVELILLPYFLLIYLPFYLIQKKQIYTK